MGNKKKKGQSGYKCELCDDRDEKKPIVACDVCDKWHHFSCVNISSISKKDPWICDRCKSPKAKVATGTPSTYSCELCRHADNNQMLQCSECQKKYHFVCVEPDLEKLPKPFMCKKCYATQLSSKIHQTISSRGRPSELFNFTDTIERLADISVHSRPVSAQSLSQSQISRRRSQLQLDYLEEQRKFHERWNRERELQEQEYLQKKYKVLKENVDFDTPANPPTQRKQYTEMWINSLSQHQLDRDLKNVNGQAEDIFDMGDFMERLKRLKYDSTSPLKQPNKSFKGSMVQGHQYELPKRTNHPKLNDSTHLFNDHTDHSKFGPQGQTHNYTKQSDFTKNDNVGFKLNDQTDHSKFRPQGETFHFGKNVRLPEDDNKVNNDPLGQTKFRQMVNTQTPLPDADFHLTSMGQQEHTLSKAQIASRHVVKSALQYFYGDPLEWTSWYSSYENSTILCGYTDGENLLRLKDCLKGKAEKAVKHRLLSPLEVPNIIKTLRMLFGRPEQIVNVLLKTIRDIPAPKLDRLETLVDYAMEVNSISATIESAKLHYHLSNPTLIHELVEKLPVHTKIDWAKFKSTQPNTTLKVLADWLYNLAEVVCTVTDQTSSKPENKFDKKSRKGFERVNVHQFEKDNSKSLNSLSDNNNTCDKSRQSSQCKICNGKCSEIPKCPTEVGFSPQKQIMSKMFTSSQWLLSTNERMWNQRMRFQASSNTSQ